MKSYLFFVFFIIYIFFITGNIEAKTIHIPADYPTIQTGIDSSDPGDVVLVSKGTYPGGINMKGGIHLKSEEGPESTIISGELSITSVVRCIDLTDTALIDGFTICDCNKDAFCGGGIYSNNSNIIIRNNIIRGNTLEPYMGISVAGGGIYVNGGSALIENNIIRGNKVKEEVFKNKKKSDIMLVKDGGNNLQVGWFDAHGGGGIYAESTMVIIKNNLILENSAELGSYAGGGIRCRECIKAVIFNNLIDSNWAGNDKDVFGYGMGIYCDAPVEIINNTIVNNYFEYFTIGNGQGGGIYCERNSSGQDSIIIKNNIIAFDSASIFDSTFIIGGGGIYCEDSLDKVFIGYNGFYLNIPDNFYNAPQGVGNFSWGTNRNGNPCDSFYNINIDPGFTSGPLGNYYQQNVLGCGDYIVDGEFRFKGGNTTDGNADTGWVDLGYHYGVSIIGVEEKEVSPPEADQNLELKVAPNPFTTMTGIKWSKGGEGQKNNIRIYDLGGRLVKTTNNNIIGTDLKPGIYFVKINNYKPIKIVKMSYLR
ncbi:MAG: T9SS type A sorting domain-containing protein [bacterium]|nr:T9SS type A sorting domain-containing protein [bacterium]